MLGYSLVARKLDKEIEAKLANKPPGLWTEEDKIAYRSCQLAKWDTSGYPKWPQKLVDQGIAKVEHKDILSSEFWFPLKYLIAYLQEETEQTGPIVIQEDGIASKKVIYGLAIFEDRIKLCDPEEIIELSRWDMS